MRLALHVLPSVLLLNFNPRIPYGMRLVSRIYIIKQDLFQSTHPVWDATHDGHGHDRIQRFQSTHPVWDATRANRTTGVLLEISIHASRMGCDHQPADCHSRAGISIHASRMGCDDQGQTKLHQVADFNPRIPYGMRPAHPANTRPAIDFNPRIPYGMRLFFSPLPASLCVFRQINLRVVTS